MPDMTRQPDPRGGHRVGPVQPPIVDPELDPDAVARLETMRVAPLNPPVSTWVEGDEGDPLLPETVWVLWRREPDGTGTGVLRVYYDGERARQDRELLAMETDRQVLLTEVALVPDPPLWEMETEALDD